MRCHAGAQSDRVVGAFELYARAMSDLAVFFTASAKEDTQNTAAAYW
jgi:hypothetical protein